jgi:hypothetical protein
VALAWDDSNMSVTQSDLAKAEVETGGVRVDFGVVLKNESGNASDVRLQKRILLDPESATNLVKLLNSMISRQNPNAS